MGKSRSGKKGWKTQTTEESKASETEPFPGGSGVNEFERESVPESSLKSLSSFVGMYAGEHTAGTEFMIGPLFVAHGVTAFDVLVGLFLGNLMAVLSWGLLCAPIAVRVRQTMYYQLERICGVRLVTLYNLANGLMFCFLAGAMVSVSATAVGIPFNMKMPGLNDWLPNSVGWIVAVVAVGMAISLIAAKGYDAVARFANIASPWMVLVFLACGIAALPHLGIHSLADFWPVANKVVWTGAPIQGQSQYTFWHVFCFAWFCNLAMHAGMSDLSIFRYARKASYGYASAAGMYVGHYMAWISAALLYALQLKINPEDTTVAPGPMAVNIAGLAGAVCVIVAGWTTANPTIYRAGLAFQILFKKWSRFTVTLIAGSVATIGAIFPALVMKLLDFVALYGLILMPMGTVIFLDYWVLPKLNLKSFFAETARIATNWAAGAAWILTLCLCLALYLLAGIEKFFLFIPGWFIAAALYIAGSMIIQRNTYPETGR
jgi:purine-cytosine permease-like protein